MDAAERTIRRRFWLWQASVLLAATIAFSPALSADFIWWDDQDFVIRNDHLHDAAGLAEIWYPHGTRFQYYPLTFTSFWVDYHLWGLDAHGYHAVNLILHLANVLLVALLLRECGASTWFSTVAAAVFAVHPVQVESVLWVSERKNLLSGLFYLAAFICYIRHRRTGNRGAYAASLIHYVAALLAKTQTLTLPVSLWIADRLLQRDGQLRSVPAARLATRLAPMAVLSVCFAILSSRIEQRPWTPAPLFTERILTAATAAWFYVGTFIAPFNLAPIYREWEVSIAHPGWWIGVVAWLAVLAAVVRWRRRVDALTLLGMAQFVIVIVPVVGLLPFNFQQYAPVANHLLYLACIGGGFVVAGVTQRIRAHGSVALRAVVAAAVAAMLLGFAIQTHRETRYWQDNETFWRHAAERNPASFAAHVNLAEHYRRHGDWARALPWYQRASEIWPNNTLGFSGYAQAVNQVNGPAAAIEACSARLRDTPDFYPAYLERGGYYESLGHMTEAIADYERVMQLAPAGSAWRTEAQRRTARLQPRP